MSIPPRLRAGAIIAAVWGVFFGLVGAAMRAAFLLMRPRGPADPDLPLGPVLESFFANAGLGLVLGTAFVVLLAFARLPTRDGRLTAGRAALFGGVGGGLAGAVATLISLGGDIGLVGFLWVAAALGAVSAGVGAAIVGSAEQKALPQSSGGAVRLE